MEIQVHPKELDFGIIQENILYSMTFLVNISGLSTFQLRAYGNVPRAFLRINLPPNNGMVNVISIKPSEVNRYYIEVGYLGISNDNFGCNSASSLNDSFEEEGMKSQEFESSIQLLLNDSKSTVFNMKVKGTLLSTSTYCELKKINPGRLKKTNPLLGSRVVKAYSNSTDAARMLNLGFTSVFFNLQDVEGSSRLGITKTLTGRNVESQFAHVRTDDLKSFIVVFPPTADVNYYDEKVEMVCGEGEAEKQKMEEEREEERRKKKRVEREKKRMEAKAKRKEVEKDILVLKRFDRTKLVNMLKLAEKRNVLNEEVGDVKETVLLKSFVDIFLRTRISHGKFLSLLYSRIERLEKLSYFEKVFPREEHSAVKIPYVASAELCAQPGRDTLFKKLSKDMFRLGITKNGEVNSLAKEKTEENKKNWDNTTRNFFNLSYSAIPSAAAVSACLSPVAFVDDVLGSSLVTSSFSGLPAFLSVQARYYWDLGGRFAVLCKYLWDLIVVDDILLRRSFEDTDQFCEDVPLEMCKKQNEKIVIGVPTSNSQFCKGVDSEMMDFFLKKTESLMGSAALAVKDLDLNFDVSFEQLMKQNREKGQIDEEVSKSISGKFKSILKEVDAVMFPTAKVGPRKLCEKFVRLNSTGSGEIEFDVAGKYLENSAFAALSGLPTMNIPIGVTKNKYHCGVTVVCRDFAGMLLLCQKVSKI